MIEVKSVTKRFGDRVAVGDVSFTVNKGEIMGFLGPNGAGKTTTMRIITGFMPPTEGDIEVNGLDVFEHHYEVKKMIGYMPEHPPLYLEMTVEGYLRFAAEVRGMRGRSVGEAVRKVIEICGLKEVSRRLVGNLSKGYRQRVGLAQAIVHDPEVLVLDEPTVGLDPRQIVEIRQLIKSLGREKTVILSTHILPEVTTVCDSVTIINNGRIAVSDRIDRLTDRFSVESKVHAKVSRPDRIDRVMLDNIPGVSRVRFLSDGDLEVGFEKGAGVRIEEVTKALVDNGAGVLEIRPVGLTLEEIFLKAVTEDFAGIA